MKNPYEVLEVSQDASNPQILKAMTVAMRKKAYSNSDIAQARSQLSKPATRLAADFTFPVFDACGEMKPLTAALQPEYIDIDTLNPDSYNSL